MRKAIVLLVVCCLFLLMAGCNGRTVTGGQQPVAAPTSQTRQVGQPLTGLLWIKMIDARSGWAVDREAVLRTTDGGATWQDVTPPHIQALLDSSVCFLDADTGWVAGYNQGKMTLWRTKDGGRDWDSARVQDTFSVPGISGGRFIGLTSLDFSDRNHGWILLTGGVAMGSELVGVLTTVDSGASWQVLGIAAPGQEAAGALPFGGRKNGLSFADSEHGWIAGSYNGNGFWLLRTADGGKTWHSQNLPAVKGLSTEGGSVATFQPFFSGSEGVLPVGFYGGGQTLVFYRTYDRGLTWKATTPLPTSGGQPPVWSILSPERFFVTAGAHIYTTGDGGETWKTIPLQSKPGVVRQIDFLDGSNGWMLGDGFALQTRDGGETWTALQAVVLPQHYTVPEGSAAVGFQRITSSDTWQEPADKPQQFRDVYQQNCFVIANTAEITLQALGLNNLESQGNAPSSSNEALFNILTLKNNVAAINKTPDGDVVVTLSPKDAGYDYVQIDDSQDLPGTQLDDNQKAVTLLFVDQQGSVLARVTSQTL